MISMHLYINVKPYSASIDLPILIHVMAAIHKLGMSSAIVLFKPSHLSTATKMFEPPFQSLVSLVNGIPRKCGNPRHIGPYHPEQIITQLKCLKSLILGLSMAHAATWFPPE